MALKYGDIALVEPFARAVLPGGGLKEIVEAKRRAVVLEPPVTDARHSKRAGARFENQSQSIVDGYRHASLASGQFGQGLALRRQTPLALAQFLL